MARPKTKDELIIAGNEYFEKLWNMIDSLPQIVLDTSFDFSNETNKKEAHWQRDKNLRDVLIHLYEWHLLLIHWIESNENGEKRDFLPPPYNWKTYGKMNEEFWNKHQHTSLEEAKKLLKSSHQKVMKIIETYSNEALFTKKYFSWTGSTSLGAYGVSALSSHYDWAIKKLKAHQKIVLTH